MEHVEVKYQGGKKFLAQNGRHNIEIDLPEDFGGTDQGPTPTGLFIDALGACIGVYVAGYCNSAGLNAEGMLIGVSWEKEVKQRPFYIKDIDVTIGLPNADVGSRKEALLKIAQSCLIHQTIKFHPDIRISLK